MKRIENFYDYVITKTGRVFSFKTRKWLKPQWVGGYLSVGFYIKGRVQPKFFAVHKLVAKAFISNPNNLSCVLHKDDNRENNYFENLYWGTAKDNILDRTKNRGHYFKRHKISWSEAKEIRSLFKQGIKQIDLAYQYDVTPTCIWSIIHYKSF